MSTLELHKPMTCAVQWRVRNLYFWYTYNCCFKEPVFDTLCFTYLW